MQSKLKLALVVLAPLAAAQIAPDPRLRANRNTYSPIMELMQAKRTPVTDEQLEKLKTLPLEAVWTGIQRQGYTECHFAGLKTTRPGERLVGRALTMRFLPQRPDLLEATEALAKEGDWPRRFYVRAAEEAKPGDVLVVDLGGTVGNNVFAGDICSLGQMLAGARGVVLWGATRDYEELQKMEGFPVLAVGFDPRPATQLGVDWNIPVRVGDATVIPGDVVVGDSEAVLFFPPQLAGKVIEIATEIRDHENFQRGLAREKKYRFRDVYPFTDEVKKKMERESGGRQR